MTTSPQVSVVMSVYNGAESLRDSVESVLSQEGVDLEFIIVNDGSTDASASLLDSFAAADARIRLLHQANQGLTRALINGCALARGKYIARQDCGDRSLPGRLRAQVETMQLHPESALVSCGTRFFGPNLEPLYDVTLTEAEAQTGLQTLELTQLHGPAHHGSTLFRRDLYGRVGGYREQFYFAQDLDLWTRMVEHGRHVAMPDLLYQAIFALGSISSLQRQRQIECATLILECARLRRDGQSDAPVLSRARQIVPQRGKASSTETASALYFVGTCLSKRRDPRARRYYREALRANPLHIRSAIRLLLG